LDYLVKCGKILLSYRNDLIERALSATAWKRFGEDNDVIPVVNSSQFPSEIGNALCTRNPGAKYALTWYERKDGKYYLSFRSTGYDVEKIAKSLGGGGHRRASGVIIPSWKMRGLMAEASYYEVSEILKNNGV
jgi:nanoRNase/pAp phosphatase (c-di-AMP/oligoRNAs hydrolase)